MQHTPSIRIAIAASEIFQFTRPGHRLLRRQRNTTGLSDPDIAIRRVDLKSFAPSTSTPAKSPARREAIFAPAQPIPNGSSADRRPVLVRMGRWADGVAPHMAGLSADRRFMPADLPATDVTRTLRDSERDLAELTCPLARRRRTSSMRRPASMPAYPGHCVPVFIVSDPVWSRRFAERGIPAWATM